VHCSNKPKYLQHRLEREEIYKYLAELVFKEWATKTETASLNSGDLKKANVKRKEKINGGIERMDWGMYRINGYFCNFLFGHIQRDLGV
jgi:hypothetical protein